jgi:hypothetical protein
MSVLLPLDQEIIHTAEKHYPSQMVRRMLANISVACDGNVNVLEVLHMVTAAWKNFSITMVPYCWHKVSILSVKDKIME